MIFVTGGTGLIGSQLLFDLASSGKIVRALKRVESDMKVFNRHFRLQPELLKNIEWVEGDLNDVYSLDDALEGIETVYHAAAFISFLPRDRDRMMKVNIEGTSNMVNLSMKQNVKRFCYVSSASALGRIRGENHIDETAVWKTSDDNSNYGISKYGGEREVWRSMEEGLSAFIINPTIVIGPGDWKSGSSQMFTQISKGFSFYTSGVTGFVDVRDVTKSAIALMRKGISNERYIINSENTSYKNVFDRIAECLNKKKSSVKISPALGQIGWRFEKIKSLLLGKDPVITKETTVSAFQQSYFSNEKIKKEIGIEFIPVERSVSETCVEFLK